MFVIDKSELVFQVFSWCCRVDVQVPWSADVVSQVVLHSAGRLWASSWRWPRSLVRLSSECAAVALEDDAEHRW